MTATTSLAVDDLLSVASDRTGLSEYGDPWFQEPLQVLVDSLETEARLNDAGREMTRRRLVSLLSDRLRLRAFQREHPEVLDIPVRVAAEILGMPRTGSTLLHRLLTAPPGVTSTVSWEMALPIPLPDEGPGAEERKRRVRARMEAAAAASPEFAGIHPTSWDAVEEDVTLVDRSFTSVTFDSFYWVPSYGDWLRSTDQSRAYAELREWLQVLSWGDPARQARPWVLKSPHHLTAVGTVLDAFPDCRVVMTHRSPRDTVPSYASMVAALSVISTDGLDPAALGPYWSARFQESLGRLEDERAGRPDRFVDVRYADLQSTPVETALRTLDDLGLQPSEADAAAVRASIQQRDQHQRHTYTPEQYGLDPAALDRDFADYTRRYL